MNQNDKSTTAPVASVAATGLEKSYGSLKVLKGIDLNVRRGEIVALLGPNGAGKTTTIKILSTLLSPDAGRASVNGFDISRQPAQVKASIGLTGQYAAVDEYLTGRENLEMVGRLYQLSKNDARRRAEDLLRTFDLLDAEKRTVKNYSGGMRRRIDLAMSLIASPPVLFLDEPTTGLDPRSRLTMWEIIKELAATDVTVLLTTQYMEEADNLADRIVVIDHGQIIAQGTPAELKGRVGSDQLEFIISEDSDFEQAVKILGHDGVHTDSKRRGISISTTHGVADLKKILNRLEDSGIKVKNLSLHPPTLDDVFLSLTGHATEETTANNNEEGKK